MAGPGLVIVSLRRSTTCAGTPAQLPDPRAQRVRYRWATARTSPRSISGTAPSHLARPSQVRATRSRGDGAAGLPRPEVADPGRREGPWHAGSCSSAFVAGGAGRGGGPQYPGMWEREGSASPSRNRGWSSFYSSGTLQMLAVKRPSSSRRQILSSSPFYRWGRMEVNDVRLRSLGEEVAHLAVSRARLRTTVLCCP